ncbi:MAG: peptidyl-prolyl cis-trans isomerase [Candidatus Omnitrophota bacterium]|nr:peptidyl-prolyl cis-trans isomerase [Candidatus Omnitrophota bacterium]
MLKNKRDMTNILFCLFLLLGITGCDQIRQIKDYFVKPHEKAAEPVAVPQAVQPSAGVVEKKTEAKMGPDTLAKVGQWTMTIGEFEDRLSALKEVAPDFDIGNPQNKKDILEELIRQELLVQDAEKSGLASQKDIQDAIEEFRRTLIIRQLAQQLTEGVEVTDEEAKDFYERNQQSIVEPTDWHLREIAFSDQLKANEVLTEILKGTTDFAEMAKTYSTSPSAPNGGDLGWVRNVEELPFPELAQPLLTLKAGEVSGVLKHEDKYYIVKVEEIKGGEAIPFEKVKDQITSNQLLRKQQEILINYINKLREGVAVEVNESLLK